MSKSVRPAKKPLQLAGAGVELEVLKGKKRDFSQAEQKGPGATEAPGPAGRMPRKRMCHHSLPAYHKRNMFSRGKRLENEA